MKIPSLYDKILELYVEKDDPDGAAVRRAAKSYLRKGYSAKKMEKLAEEMSERYDFVREGQRIRNRNFLGGYMDSVILGRIREVYKSSKALDIDQLEELKFKALVKQVILHFGYQQLYMPENGGDNVDMIVHRGQVRIAVHAVKCDPDSMAGARTVRQARHIADYYHCEQVFLITSTCFDREAIEQAKELGVTLLDKEKFLPLVQDLIENRRRRELEFSLSGINNTERPLYLEGLIKSPKSKIQVAYITYSPGDADKTLVFEGELVNKGKRPVVNLFIDIAVFNRAGACAYRRAAAVECEKLDSNEHVPFKVVLEGISQADWNQVCRYELKLEYANVGT